VAISSEIPIIEVVVLVEVNVGRADDGILGMLMMGVSMHVIMLR
jgi:hypothetical protein